jgi:hypothetical protein
MKSKHFDRTNQCELKIDQKRTEGNRELRLFRIHADIHTYHNEQTNSFHVDRMV